MAISTNAAIEFFGTQDTVTSSSSSVSNGSFSVSGDVSAWVNDDDAPMAAAVLGCTFSVAPTSNRTVELFAQLNDIDGSTGDQLAPTDAFPHVYLGAFPVKNVTSAQLIPIDIALPNVLTSQSYTFFVKNNAGQTMGSGWTLRITPKTIGPHA